MSSLPHRSHSSRTARTLVALYRAWTRLYPIPVRVHDRKEMVACFAQMVDAAQTDPRTLRLLRFVLRCALTEPLVLAAVWRDQLLQSWQYYKNVRRHSGGSLMFDLRQASRQLLRRPGVTLLIVLCLGIGVGATTALLSAVDAVLWRSQPVVEPERLVRVFEVDEHGVHDLNHGDFMTIQQGTASLFDGLSAHRLETFALQPGDDRSAGTTRVVYGELVSSSYFDMLQAPLAFGQTFSTESEPPEGRLATVISHHLFETVFDSNPEVIGRVVRLDDVPIEILGVMQPEFQGTKFGLSMDLWVPARPWGHAKNWPDQWESLHRGSSWYSLGRLKDGVTFDQVQTSLGRIAEELAGLYPETHERTGFRIYDNRLSDATPHGGEAAGLISTLAILGGALVLLVACSNVAALMLARGATRSGELNIRAALGAGRGTPGQRFDVGESCSWLCSAAWLDWGSPSSARWCWNGFSHRCPTAWASTSRRSRGSSSIGLAGGTCRAPSYSDCGRRCGRPAPSQLSLRVSAPPTLDAPLHERSGFGGGREWWPCHSSRWCWQDSSNAVSDNRASDGSRLRARKPSARRLRHQPRR